LTPASLPRQIGRDCNSSQPAEAGRQAGRGRHSSWNDTAPATETSQMVEKETGGLVIYEQFLS